jgi:uncharacterized protein (DUF1800 family)
MGNHETRENHIMTLSRRDFFKFSAAAGGTAAAIGLWGAPAALASRGEHTAAFPTGQTGIVDETGIIHLLNRLTYGARPADVAYVSQIGIEAYIEEQLNPLTIDDAAVESRLRMNPILEMDRFTIHRLPGKEYRAYKALASGFFDRAVYSKRQLQERMVEFWTDHFNIAADELSPDLVILHRETIRPNALGSFRDLLFGTARNPAMLYYLDNYLSDAEHPNENYARELMELHTLGVDGGHYTERDVTEVARALTGWTIFDGTSDGFYFDPSMHDVGEKTILGHSFPAGRGIEDGLHVLSILANHPATARYVCFKLCRRFVSDFPPETIVQSATDVWMQTEGDIAAVMRHIFYSDEFWASSGQKLRRPLDFLTAAMRVTETEVHEWWRMEEIFNELSQPPYGWQPPNGYPDVGAAWMNTGALLGRWNAAMALTHDANTDPGTGATVNLNERVGLPHTVGELVDSVATQVYAAPLTDEARAPFIAYVADGGGAETLVDGRLLARKTASLFGLMIAAPGFQWR